MRDNSTNCGDQIYSIIRLSYDFCVIVESQLCENCDGPNEKVSYSCVIVI